MDTELWVTIDGVKSGDGQVIVALFDSETNHLQRGQQVRRSSITARPGGVRLRFDALRPSRYSLVAFHDEDSDGDMRRNAIGWPAEGLGFSNDRFISVLGAPSFKRTAIKLNRGRNETVIRLRY